MAQTLEAMDEAVHEIRLGVFTRLVNSARYEEAKAVDQTHGISALARRHASVVAGRDALIAGLFLDMSPAGELAQVPGRLEAVLRTGPDEAQAKGFILSAFVVLVNGQAFEAAQALLKQVEPLLLTLAVPYAPAERDALFAAGILFLQEKKTWPRSAASFTRLRDALAKLAPRARCRPRYSGRPCAVR